MVHRYLTLAFLAIFATANTLCAADVERPRAKIVATKRHAPPKTRQLDRNLGAKSAYPKLPTFAAIKENLWRVNPSNSRSNCLACSVSVLRWIKTGAALPIEAQNTERIMMFENFLEDGRSYLRMNEDVFAKEILGAMPTEFVNHEDAVSYVVEKVVFTPLDLENLDSTMATMPLKIFSSPSEPDKNFNYGMLYVIDEVNEEGVTMGHFYSFAVYENNRGGRNINIIDGQNRTIFTVKSFIEKQNSHINNKMFIWYDSVEYRDLSKMTTKRPAWTVKNEVMNLPSCTRSVPEQEVYTSPIRIKQEAPWSDSARQNINTPQGSVYAVEDQDMGDATMAATQSPEPMVVNEEELIVTDEVADKCSVDDVEMLEDDDEVQGDQNNRCAPPVTVEGNKVKIRVRKGLPDISTVKVPIALRGNRFKFQLGTPRKLSGAPFFNFKVDGQRVSIQAVEGDNMISYFNAVGLDNVLQAILLLSKRSERDPILRFMIANEKAFRTPNANFSHLRNLIYNDPSRYRSFIRYELSNDNIKAVVNRVSGGFTRFVGAIDAIAYLNKFGLRIFEVENKELKLLHEYIPESAEKVVSLVYCNGKFYPFVAGVESADVQFQMPSNDWLQRIYPDIVTDLPHHNYPASDVRKIIYLNAIGVDTSKMALHVGLMDRRRISDILIANGYRNHAAHPNAVKDIVLHAYVQHHKDLLDGKISLAKLSEAIANHLASLGYDNYTDKTIESIIGNNKRKCEIELSDIVISNIIESYSISQRPSLTAIQESAKIKMPCLIKILLENMDQRQVKNFVDLGLKLNPYSNRRQEELITGAYEAVAQAKQGIVRISAIQKHLEDEDHHFGWKTIDRILKKHSLPVLRTAKLSEKDVTTIRARHAELLESGTRSIYQVLSGEFGVDREKLKAICEGELYHSQKYQKRKEFREAVKNTLPSLTPDQQREPVKHLMAVTNHSKRAVQYTLKDLEIPTERQLKRAFIEAADEGGKHKKRRLDDWQGDNVDED